MTKRSLPAHVYDKKGVLYFQRRGWPTARIAATVGTTAFALEYAALLNGARIAPAASSRTFSALVDSYINDRRYKKLAPRTAADYDKVLLWIRSRLGALPVDGMRRKDVIRARDANADRTRFANYIVQVLRVLFEHAIDIGWIGAGTNPAKGVTMIKADTEERLAWPAEMIEKFRLAARDEALLIFELCLGTGQRIGDVLKMCWSDIAGDGINVVQNKTGARLWIPFTSRLREILTRTPRRSLMIIAPIRGVSRPVSYRAAAQRISKVRAEIGAERYDIHGLRYSAASELAAAGCSDDLISAVTGHATAAMVRKYAGAERQKIRAIKAQEARE